MNVGEYIADSAAISVVRTLSIVGRFDFGSEACSAATDPRVSSTTMCSVVGEASDCLRSLS